MGASEHSSASDARAGQENAAKYWAFISYSHVDEKFAAWLHKSLERYTVPRSLRKSDGPGDLSPKRLAPIFLDRNELPSSPSLAATIEQALIDSRFLIVVCSPNAAASQYVNQEVSVFKRLGRSDRVLSVVIDGEPNATDNPELGLPEAFPAAIRFEVDSDGNLSDRPAQPIAADARQGKDGRSNALLKTIAGILGVGFDVLKQREKRRKLINRIQAAAAVLTVAAVIGAVWFTQSQQTRLQERISSAHEASPRASRMFDAGGEETELGTLLAAESLRLLIGFDEPFDASYSAVIEGVSLLPNKPLVMTGHAETIATVAVSPDSHWLASQDDTELRVWDVDSGDHVLSLQYSRGAGPLRFSPDSQWLAYADGPEVYSLDMGSLSTRLRADHDSPVELLAISPDSAWVASAGNTQLAIARRGENTSQEYRLEDNVFAASFDSNSQRLTVIGGNYTRVFDIQTRRPAEPTRMTTLQPRALSSTSDWLITGESRQFTVIVGELGIWNTQSSRPVASVTLNREGGAAFPSDIAFDSTGRFFAASSANQSMTGARDSMTKVWEAEDGTLVGRVDHTDYVSELSLSANGRWLMTDYQSGRVHLWDVIASTPIREFDEFGVFSPDSNWLVTHEGSSAIVNEAMSGREVARLLHDEASDIQTSTFSPDGRWLITAADTALSRWNIYAAPGVSQSVREPLQSAGIFSGYYTIFSEDSSRIAAVDSEHLHVWDAKSGAPIAKLSVAGNARILDISHDGRLVAVASGVTLGASMLISVWQVDAGQREVISASDTIYDARFETDGDHILIWTQDSVARYAHREGLVTESLSLSDYPAPEDGRLRAATRQNGRWAASAEIVDDVFTVTVRSAGGPDRAIVLTAEAADAVFSPDQRTLATISRDGFLQLWVWSPDDLISEACARVGRSMTRAEWSEYFEHEAYEPSCQP